MCFGEQLGFVHLFPAKQRRSLQAKVWVCFKMIPSRPLQIGFLLKWVSHMWLFAVTWM